MSDERDIAGQVMALLTSKSCEYACTKLGVENLIDRSYAEAFDITWDELTAYIETHGLRVEDYTEYSCFTLEQTAEGWTIVQRWPAEKTPEYFSEYPHPDLASARTDLLVRIVSYSGWKIRPNDHPNGPWIPPPLPRHRSGTDSWFARLSRCLFGG